MGCVRVYRRGRGARRAGGPHAAAPFKADITFGNSVVDSHLHGRVYLLVRPGTADPLSSVSATGSTLVFGKDISDVAPGQSVSLSGGGDGFEGVYGFPKASLDDLPSGQYTVRAFFNVYETAHRSDGSTVDVHFPCGDGGRPFSSPGNLRSAMQTVTIDRNQDTSLALTLAEKLTPAQAVPAGGTCQQGNPAESAHVKQVKIKSDVLSKFWGRDMYVAATVLLPWDYDDAANAGKRYPVVYSQGHYSTGVPFGFSETATTGLSGWWRDPANPKMIGVSFRTENPFYDDSYVVNSPNLGPYGDAINDELIPKLDAMFRTIARPYARALTGGSTGGWITVANQIFRPDLFGSAWSGYPDSLDFNAHQTVDLYNANSAYVEDNGDVIPSSHNYNIATGVDTVTLTMPNGEPLRAGGRQPDPLPGRPVGHLERRVRRPGGQLLPARAVEQGHGRDRPRRGRQVEGDGHERGPDRPLGDARPGPARQAAHLGRHPGHVLPQRGREGVPGHRGRAERGHELRHVHLRRRPAARLHAVRVDAGDADRHPQLHHGAHAARGSPDPDLSATRGNSWADVSANSCATRTRRRRRSPAARPSAPRSPPTRATGTPAWRSRYQWKRDGAAIGGATGSTYTTVTADVGHAITVAVTGAKLGYDTTTQTSDPVTVTPKTTGVAGTVGGSVPATLSLTLGAPATFGAFTPGADRRTTRRRRRPTWSPPRATPR